MRADQADILLEALDRIAEALERIDSGLAEANHRQAVK